MATSTHPAPAQPAVGFARAWFPPRRVLPVPLASTRSCRLPSPSPRVLPKSAPSAGRGTRRAPRPEGRVPPNCPTDTSGGLPAAPRAPGRPSPPPRPPRRPPRAAHLPPVAGPHARSPCQLLPPSCPPPAPSPYHSAARPRAAGAPKRPRDRLTPRDAPQRPGPERLSAPPEGVRRGAELAGCPVLPDNLSPPTALTWLAPAAGVGGRASRPPSPSAAAPTLRHALPASARPRPDARLKRLGGGGEGARGRASARGGGGAG